MTGNKKYLVLLRQILSRELKKRSHRHATLATILHHRAAHRVQYFHDLCLVWSLALPEYMCQVPANRIGFDGNGGPFNIMQLKVIQEVVSLTVFTVFVTVFFNGESLRWNHLAAFICLVMAVFFVFHKW